ncbi:hypothetical protein [Paracoccus cavernae]|uniref:hypothetical protein n=1 Tax=Paracoccus cavernae TaxID=1571207 RepID=UPI003636EB7E
MQGLFVSCDLGVGDVVRRELHSQRCCAICLRNPSDGALHNIFGQRRCTAMLKAKRAAGLLPIGVAKTIEAAVVAFGRVPPVPDLHRNPA